MTKFDPGKMRHKLVVKRATKTQNASGEDVLAFSTLFTIWGDVKAMQGRELEAAQQRFGEARFRIVTWTPPTVIRREDRIYWGTRVLDILDAEDPAGTGQSIVIMAKEVT